MNDVVTKELSAPPSYHERQRRIGCFSVRQAICRVLEHYYDAELSDYECQESLYRNNHILTDLQALKDALDADRGDLESWQVPKPAWLASKEYPPSLGELIVTRRSVELLGDNLICRMLADAEDIWSHPIEGDFVDALRTTRTLVRTIQVDVQLAIAPDRSVSLLSISTDDFQDPNDFYGFEEMWTANWLLEGADPATKAKPFELPE
jgi:hypothetical protein